MSATRKKVVVGVSDRPRNLAKLVLRWPDCPPITIPIPSDFPALRAALDDPRKIVEAYLPFATDRDLKFAETALVQTLWDKLSDLSNWEIQQAKLDPLCGEEACELADGQLFIKGRPPWRLLAPEWAVLEAIAKYCALELDQLRAKSNVGDANKVLKSLDEKYPALKVRMPGGKGKGSYWASVKMRDWYAQGIREAPKS